GSPAPLVPAAPDGSGDELRDPPDGRAAGTLDIRRPLARAVARQRANVQHTQLDSPPLFTVPRPAMAGTFYLIYGQPAASGIGGWLARGIGCCSSCRPLAHSQTIERAADGSARICVTPC